METDGGDQPLQPDKKYYIDTVYMKHPRKGMELCSFLKDGMSKCNISCQLVLDFVTYVLI